MDRTPKPEERLRVADTLQSTTGMMIAPDRLARRRAGAVGFALGYVGGHGGDVWWVNHEGDDPDDVAPYALTELEPAP